MDQVDTFDPAKLADIQKKLQDGEAEQLIRAEEAWTKYQQKKLADLREELAFKLRIDQEVYEHGLFLTEDQMQKQLAIYQKELEAKQAEQDKELEKELQKRIALLEDEYAADTALGGTKAADAIALLNEEFAARREQAQAQHEQDLQDAEELYKQKLADGKKLQKKLTEEEAKQKEKDKKKKAREEGKKRRDAAKDALSKEGLSPKERLEALKSSFFVKGEDGKDKFNLGAGLSTIVGALSDMAKALEKEIDNIGKHKSSIDTRLQGSKNDKTLLGSYWDQMSRDITQIAGVSPLIKQADVVAKLEDLVKKGISYNVEQRAFLSAMTDRIASTFNIADSTMLRLIRLQQQDSTAARMGMESALNAMLNNMYETSEYLSDLASNVRSSLEEAEALMDAAMSTELEWQVQKWMGSLYSVGMSSKGVSAISDALGKLAAGDISGITNGGAGNLMVMAANQAGISLENVLAKGLNADTTNQLLSAMVKYLSGIYDSSKESRVVQQQIASVYGLQASDLKALTNLTTENTSIATSTLTLLTNNNNLNYQDMLNRLGEMAGSMAARTSMGELLSNIWDNFQYTMAAGIADNPVLYATYKIAGLLDSAVGGIAIPAISVMGNMIDLHTTVADLMRVAAMSGSMLSGIGNIIAGVVRSGGDVTGRGMLTALGALSGLSEDTKVKRGGGNVITTSGGFTQSESGVMTAAETGENVKEKTLADANADAKAQQIAAQEEEDNDIDRKTINSTIVQIYDLLSDVVNGNKSFTVMSAGGNAASGWQRGGNYNDEIGNL